MKLPQFTKKDLLILATNLPILVLFIDFMLFGKRLFSEPEVLLNSFLIVSAVFLPLWFVFTWIAVQFRERFPANKDTLKRIVLTILTLASIQALLNTSFFLGFDYFHIEGYVLNKTRFVLTLVIFFFINVIVTLMHEGFESFEKWKSSLHEAEKLKTAYARSHLMSLKSQVNPHFLFNCLNSLSSLIADDEEKAEQFLNELTKVYRYFLRDKDEQLIALKDELRFIESYFFLQRARYGDGVVLEVEVDPASLGHLLPPLTLQVLVENIFNLHTIHKDKPLHIKISTLPNGWLQVENNVQKKVLAAPMLSPGMENLADKIRLLMHETLVVIDNEERNIVQLPLITNQSATAA